MALCGADNVIYYTNQSFRNLLNIQENSDSLLIKRWFEFCSLEDQFKVMNDVLPALNKKSHIQLQLNWHLDSHYSVASKTDLSITDDNQLLIIIDPIEIPEED
jgi:hypothetical protein